jgi:hypothetical protein
MKIDIEDIKKRWLVNERAKIGQHRGAHKPKRTYLHFDYRNRSISDKLASQIWTPGFVARHFFYPFITFKKEERRRQLDDQSGTREIKKKPRQIGYACHKDALIFSWYSYLLNTLYEKRLTELGIAANPVAYRSLDGKCNIHFAGDAFRFISKQNECVAICLDIEGFFPSIDHKLLKQTWKELLNYYGLLEFDELPLDHYKVYKAIINFDHVDKDDLLNCLDIDKKRDRDTLSKRSRICSPREFRDIVRAKKAIQSKGKEEGVGIPQGSPMSGLLSNIYMLDFDMAISGYIQSIDGFYYRYSDDLIVVVPPHKKEEVLSLLQKNIAKLKLSLQTQKTCINLFKYKKDRMQCCNEEGRPSKLSYLGIMFDGEYVYVRDASIARFYRRMNKSIRALIKLAKTNNWKSIPKKRLYKKFTTLGSSNFISYINRAIDILGDDYELNTERMKKQVTAYKSMKKVKSQLEKNKRKKDLDLR